MSRLLQTNDGDCLSRAIATGGPLCGYISEELLAIASPMLLQEWFPSIATRREVLEITCTQPMLPRLER